MRERGERRVDEAEKLVSIVERKTGFDRGGEISFKKIKSLPSKLKKLNSDIIFYWFEGSQYLVEVENKNSNYL